MKLKELIRSEAALRGFPADMTNAAIRFSTSLLVPGNAAFVERELSQSEEAQVREIFRKDMQGSTEWIRHYVERN